MASAGQWMCPEIEERLLAAIEAAGLDPAGGFSPDELGALDHLHTGGRPATLALLQLAGIEPGSRVLDIGGGIGGPARLLATSADCRVTCLEYSPDYCRGARLLNRLTGLDDRIEVHEGSALAAPFADGAFDVVWMQNVGMSIADKDGLYAEVRRVLRPDGRFVFQEVVAGSGAELPYPVPWATSPADNHLLDADELPVRVEAAGFATEAFEDASESLPPRTAHEGPLTEASFVDGIEEKAKNARRAIVDGRTRLVRGAFRRLP